MAETRRFWGPIRVACGLGALASLAVILTLADPGITIDEPLDVRPGRAYLTILKAKGFRFFDRGVIGATYRDNAEHPPLGRWLLGIASTVGQPFETILRGTDPVDLYLVSGRMAPALCFGGLVALVGGVAGSRYGRVAGLASGIALIFMPRAFAHAHLGALDTFIAFFWTLALFAAVKAIDGRRPTLGMGLAGLALGMALLTKIHAWFLPPIVLIWAFSRLKPARAVAAWATWSAVGLVTFFAGWPWLWQDPIGRLSRYLGTGVVRVPIRVLYFGQAYADKDVPWHYPWFYFAATIPVGLLWVGIGGGIRGVIGRRSDGFPVLVVGSILVFLVLFSTRVPVYDGERLFLMAFPLFAILVGIGFASIWERWGKRGRSLLATALLFQGYGVVAMHPFGLSYHNMLVGGLPGAEKMGLELTYWGDAVDAPLLDRLAELAKVGDSAAIAPTLAPSQGAVATTRRMVAVPIVLQDQEAVGKADWIVVSRRSAYWSPELISAMAKGDRVMVRSRQGVWLSALVRRRK